MVLISRAEPNHLQEVEALLLKVKLPIEGVKEAFNNFFVIHKNNMFIVCAGIEIYEDVGLLRSVAIQPSSQNQGIGQMLVSKIEEFAIESGINRLYLLTDTAEQFFHRLDYKKIPRSSTDVRIKQSIEFTTLCPSAPVMVKELKATS
jgi:amino-acid N-acetyltransferase